MEIRRRCDTIRHKQVNRRPAHSSRIHHVDLDRSGAVGEEELRVLGQARRKLGQKSGEWTKEMNQRLLQKMQAGPPLQTS